jgi:Reverse transcriptase (RNA-dependent DNA polymerase)
MSAASTTPTAVPPSLTPVHAWSLLGTSTLDETASNYALWYGSVMTTIEFHDAEHLLITSPSSTERVLHKQLIHFLLQTTHPSHHPFVDRQSGVTTWQALCALHPANDATRESLIHTAASFTLRSMSADEFQRQHVATHATLTRMDPTHPYASRISYMHRILNGIGDIDELQSIFMLYRAKRAPDITTATIHQLFADISRRMATAPRALRVSSVPGPRRSHCQFCRRDGHNIDECRSLKRYHDEKDRSRANRRPGASPARRAPAAAAHQATLEIQNMIPLLAALVKDSPPSTDGQGSYSAIFDSGASISMTNTRSHFQQCHPTRVAVRMANNTLTTAVGSGPATFHTPDMAFRIPHALHVPTLCHTLLAAGDLTRDYDVLFQRDKLFVLRRGPPPQDSTIRARGWRRQGVYHIPLCPPTASNVEHGVFNHVQPSTLATLRKRFPQAIQRIRTRLRHLTDTETPPQACAPCNTGKQTRAPFSTQEREPLLPLDVVSTDLAGPLPTTPQGMKYLQVFIDRATKYLSGQPLTSKSLARDVIIQTLARWARQHGKPVARLHSDGAKELSSHIVRATLQAAGTHLTHTAPHSSSSNPDAERIIRTIFNATRSALHAAEMPDRYWSFAALDAIAKYNVLPLTRSKDGQSPHELFHGSAPPLSHFVPFGQHGYVTNTRPHKSTLDPRATMARYMYAENKDIYVILYTATGRISTCRASEFHPTIRPRCIPQVALALTPPPKSLVAAQRRPDASDWAAAHDAEIRRHETDLSTWRYEVPLPSDRPRPYIMTYKVKHDANGGYVKHKARCAIRGDLMEAGTEYDPLRTSSHTPSHTARRTLLAAAAAASHVVESWDVPGAFPRAPTDQRYRQTMKPPVYSDGTTHAPGRVCVMQRAMQGAPDAGYQWERYRNASLARWGWSPVPSEPSAFIMRSRNGLELARLLADTDDFLVTASSSSYMAAIREPFQREWQITTQLLSPATPIQHTGLKISLLPSGAITLSNPRTISTLLQSHGLFECNPAPTPHLDGQDLTCRRPDETAADRAEYMSILGSCRFIADTTHPQTAYICGILGRHMHDPASRHMDALKRVLRYLRGVHESGVIFTGHAPHPVLTASCDTDYAQCPDTRRSTTGIALEFEHALVHWVSSKQPTISQSSSEAEYIGAAHAARDITWFRRLLFDWAVPVPSGPLVLHMDNKGAIDMAHANGPTKRTKHIDVKHHFIQQQIAAGALTIRQVPSAMQRADFLTKPLKRLLFQRACAAHHLTT